MKRPTPDTELGRRISAVIRRLGTKREAAEKAGVSTDQLTRYEKGLHSPPFEVVARLAAAAGVSLDWLATGHEPAATAPRAMPIGAKGALDEDLVRDVIETVEEYLQSRSIVVAPARKAELIITACSILRDEEESTNRKGAVLRLVKLVGG